MNADISDDELKRMNRLATRSYQVTVELATCYFCSNNFVSRTFPLWNSFSISCLAGLCNLVFSWYLIVNSSLAISFLLCQSIAQSLRAYGQMLKPSLNM